MSLITRLALASPAAILIAVPALAEYGPIETQHYTLEVETILEGLEHPWGMAFISDNQFIVTERDAGTLRVGDTEGNLSDPIWEADDLFHYEGETERSQAGLFDIVLHPEFEENGWAYVSYSRQTDHGAAVIVIRGQVVAGAEGEISFEDVEDIFEMKQEDQDSSGLHFGGRMAFDANGNFLFLSIGERRNLERAQDAADQAGSILRMSDTGQAPEDNPQFEVDPAQEGEPDPYLYTMGHRNVQAITVHPFTGEVWVVDHGPEGGDEINLLVGGSNYGWPFITGGVDYSGAPLGVGLAMEGMISPVHVFEDTVAPSGLVFVPEEANLGEWAGDMIVGGLMTEGIVRVRLEAGEVVEEEAIEIERRIRDVQVGPQGDIWVLTEHEDGEVLKLSAQQQ